MELKIDRTKFPANWDKRKHYEDEYGNVFYRGSLIKYCDGTEIKPPIIFSARNVDAEKTLEEYLEAVGGGDIKDQKPEEKQEQQVVEKKEEIGVSPHKKMPETEMNQVLKKLAELEDELAKLKSGKRGAVTDDITKLSEEIAKASAKIEGRTVYETEVDEDDWLDDPVVFTSYGQGYWIFDDKRNGVDVRIPGNSPCVFKLAATKRERIGNVESYTAICQAREYSKKRIEWLRKHSKYGKEFFENVNMAIKSDAYTVEKAIEISKRIDSWNQSQIINRCKSEGIPLGGDIRELKTLLHKKMLKRYLDEWDRQRKNEMVSSMEEKIFLDD